MCLGIPGRLIEQVDLHQLTVVVDVQGVRRHVSAAMLVTDDEMPKVGDWVVVHMGFAMSRMDEAEALTVLAGMEELDALYADELHG